MIELEVWLRIEFLIFCRAFVGGDERARTDLPGRLMVGKIIISRSAAAFRPYGAERAKATRGPPEADAFGQLCLRFSSHSRVPPTTTPFLPPAVRAGCWTQTSRRSDFIRLIIVP